MVAYAVALLPLRLDSYTCHGGHTYMCAWSRKGVEFTSGHQLCIYNGEVVFHSIPDCSASPTFHVNFESAKDRRTVNFIINDMTSKTHPREVGSAKIDLIECCDVLRCASVHTVKNIAFMMGGCDAVLAIALMMHPDGSSPPPPPSMAALEASLTHQQRDDRMTDEDADNDVEPDRQNYANDTDNPVIPADIEAEMDRIGGEMEKLSHIDEECAEEAASVRALELQLQQLSAASERDGVNSGNAKRAFEKLEASEAAALATLQSLKQQQLATPIEEVGNDDGEDDSPPSPTEDPALQDMQQQLQQSYDRRSELERMQATRDVSHEAGELSETITNLEQLISESIIKSTTNRPVSNAAQKPHRNRKPRHVTFHADGTTARSKCIAAHAEVCRLDHTLSALRAMIQGRPLPNMPPVLPPLNVVEAPAAQAVPVVPSAAAPAPPQPGQVAPAAPPKASALDDLLGPTPTAAPPPAKSTVDISDIFSAEQPRQQNMPQPPTGYFGGQQQQQQPQLQPYQPVPYQQPPPANPTAYGGPPNAAAGPRIDLFGPPASAVPAGPSFVAAQNPPQAQQIRSALQQPPRRCLFTEPGLVEVWASAPSAVESSLQVVVRNMDTLSSIDAMDVHCEDEDPFATMPPVHAGPLYIADSLFGEAKRVNTSMPLPIPPLGAVVQELRFAAAPMRPFVYGLALKKNGARIQRAVRITLS